MNNNYQIQNENTTKIRELNKQEKKRTRSFVSCLFAFAAYHLTSSPTQHATLTYQFSPSKRIESNQRCNKKEKKQCKEGNPIRPTYKHTGPAVAALGLSEEESRERGPGREATAGPLGRPFCARFSAQRQRQLSGPVPFSGSQ